MHLNWLEKFNGRSNLNRSTRQNSELADMVKLDKTDKYLKWFNQLNVNRAITVKMHKLHNLS